MTFDEAKAAVSKGAIVSRPSWGGVVWAPYFGTTGQYGAMEWPALHDDFTATDYYLVALEKS